jgi:hypothetical protein
MSMGVKRNIEDIDLCDFRTMYREDEKTGERAVYCVICFMKFKDGTYPELPKRTDDGWRPTTKLESFREAIGDETAEIPDRFKDEFRVDEIKQIITLDLKLTHQDRQFKRPFSKKIADSLRELADFVEDEKNDNEASFLLACGTSCKLQSVDPSMT